MTSDLPPDTASRVKRLRTRYHLTQSRLAELMGVTPGLISQWETERARPSPEKWLQIERGEALGLYALSPDFGQRGAAGQAGFVREAGATYTVQPNDITFSADPEVVRLMLQAHRLAYGHLANPTWATETARIEPVPHQRAAVYEHMLPQPRLRFLLADDAGAGKTIMTGLYVREMLTRRLIRRVLVVPPAGLVGNWESEMRQLFSLPFTVATGSDVRDGNPFTGPESDLRIVSVDTLAGERMFAQLQAPEVAPYDLVVFDEAHKLSASRDARFRVTKRSRYLLAEALAGAVVEDARWQLGWSAHHLLLLTATPHMGKEFPYFMLWRLLEPEVLPTPDAFQAYPPEARRMHFIRRTKEEMFGLDGTPIYPRRVSDTLDYGLTREEYQLYEGVTEYIQVTYNQARILNRSAARLAMGVFQRRMASSTYALACSLDHRLEKLEGLIERILAGEITEAELEARQRALDATTRDLLETTTADEDAPEEGRESADGREAHEAEEEAALGGTVAVNLVQLQDECREVRRLRDMARRLADDPAHEDSKFVKLLEVLRDPAYRDEKLLIFTEHRDTLTFLVRRLEQLGYTGEVAQIHGGMPYPEREAQVTAFRKPLAQGGARFLVGTDAAGEGINLQFCWRMVNYDIPWNPARLEQRMGRIHRYGQKHDPVVIVNLATSDTREGQVLRTLLDKLKAIGNDLGRDKVFDVVGQLFRGVSIADYMAQVLAAGTAEAATASLDAHLTVDDVLALEREERETFGEQEDAHAMLARQREAQSLDIFRRLLPGHVRRFVEQAAPHLQIGIEGDLDGIFAFQPRQAGALDALWPVLERYPARLRERLTVYRDKVRPPDAAEDQAIFLRPGEPVFDGFAAAFADRCGAAALRGSTFVDPTVQEAYLFHLALVEVVRAADGEIPEYAHEALLDARLVGVRQWASGALEQVPVEHLLLLRAGPGVYGEFVNLSAQIGTLRPAARAYVLNEVGEPLAAVRREALRAQLDARLDFVSKGYAYREAQLAEMRAHYRERMQEGDSTARRQYEQVRAQQQALRQQREAAAARLKRELDLIAARPVRFLAHALVMPSTDPEDRKLYDMSAEDVAMREAAAYEADCGARVVDVHTPALALAHGLAAHPGFDLLSYRPDGEIRQIEVKGRARTSGSVELLENEWIAACNGQDAFWLYAVYGCATETRALLRVRNPWQKQLGRPKGSMLIDKQSIVAAAEVTDTRL